jgi:hypothetical protein
MLFWLFSFVELLKRGCEKIWSCLKRKSVELRKYVWEHIGPLGVFRSFGQVFLQAYLFYGLV